MTPADFFNPLLGQSLLYPGQSEFYRGQCVQPVMMWIREQGIEPPVYPSAYMYYERGVIGYQKILVGSPIQDGDIVVYSKKFPPANGNGHIDVATGGTNKDYWAYDSNWNQPLKLTKVHHNGSDNQYIIGYLRRENVEPADYRMNQGDVINGFKIWNAVPSQTDLDAWTGQTFKKFQYEKITDGVAKMPPKGVKPYVIPNLFIEA